MNLMNLTLAPERVCCSVAASKKVPFYIPDQVEGGVREGADIIKWRMDRGSCGLRMLSTYMTNSTMTPATKDSQTNRHTSVVAT